MDEYMRITEEAMKKWGLARGVKIASGLVAENMTDTKEETDRKTSYQHKSLAEGRWAEMPFCLQMGNLGSEVSRSLKWYGKNEKRFRGSFERALELFDLTIEAARDDEAGSRSAKLKEVCRAREEFCDYFLGNSWGTDGAKMMRYYDQFAIMGRGL